MGHHINKRGQFKSDKYPKLPPDKIILSFKDAAAREALRLYAKLTDDKDLAWDIFTRLRTIGKEAPR